MTSLKKYSLCFFVLIIWVLVVFFCGRELEDGIRNFYRKNICHCDTLRPLFVVDNQGLPSVNYYSVSGEHIGLQTNPVEVCQYAMKYLEQGDTGLFFNSVKWLCTNYEVIRDSSDSCYVYTYHYPWLPYGVKAGWRSAMTQGMALSVLADAYHITSDSVTKKIAYQILKSFLKTPVKKGVTYLESDGYWYEEYADSNGKQPRVLNGMMHALLGLHRHYDVFHDSLSLFLFQQGILKLQKTLFYYDSPNGSYYDIFQYPASEHYHCIHIHQLNQLYQLTQNDSLLKYAQLWSKKQPDSYMVSRIKQPNTSFLLMLGLGFAIVLTCYQVSVKRNKE